MQGDQTRSRRDVLRRTTGAGAAIALGSVAGTGTGGANAVGNANAARSTNAAPGADDGVRPVVFVHGAAGSATQFESQAMRFSSNGYPDDYLEAFEYDSLVYGSGALTTDAVSRLLGDEDEDPESVLTALDETIDDVLARTGADTVDVMGHSLGTQVLGEYLGERDRATKVAHYAALDGFEPDSLPGGVPTIGVWGLDNQGSDGVFGLFGSEPSEIPGGENVYLDQTHVEVATSEETFAAVYDFFTGAPPETTEIVVEPGDVVTLEGRVQLFPSNATPAGNASIEVYEVDPGTGERRTAEPIATPEPDADGYWGPIDVDGSAHHEFVVTRDDTDSVHHHYRQPELRTNGFVRLLTSEPNAGIDRLIDKGDDHAALIALRDREWWGDQGVDSDELVIDGTNVATEKLMSRDDGVIAAFVFDAWDDGGSNLGYAGVFGLLPFMTRADLPIEAGSPPDDTIEIASTPRGGDGLQREFAVPNYPSSDHRLSLYFPDHTQSR